MKVYHSIPTIEFLTLVIEREYDIEVAKIFLYREMGGSLYFVTAKGGVRYVLKIYKVFRNDEAIKSAEIMNYLSAKGFPAVPNIKTKNGDLFSVIPMPEYQCKAFLYEFIDGEHPDVMENMTAIGGMTAQMHKVMADYPGDIPNHGRRTHIDDFIAFMQEYFPHRGLEINELAEYGSGIWHRAEKLPVGFCHDDLHNYNMILRNRSLYLYDFDAASIEHPMFDAASICDRTDFWKVTAQDVDNTIRYLDKFNDVYSRIGNLSDRELAGVFDCIAIRHYRLHGVSDKVPIKGSSYMTEQWFDNLMKWLYDFRELTAKLSNL